MTVNSGATFDALGGITIGSAGSPSVTINGGGTLSTLSGATNTLTISSATSGATVLTLGNLSALNMDVGATADEIVLSGALKASVSGAVTININGLGSLSGTTQTLISAPGGGLTGAFTLGSITGNVSGYNLALVDSSTSLTLTETLAATGSAYYTGAGGSVWNTGAGANFNNAYSSGTALSAAPGGGVTNVFIAESTDTSTSTTLGQNTSINSLSFTGTGPASSSSFTLAADGSTLTLAAVSGFTDQNSKTYASGTGLVVQAGSAAHTIAVPVALGASQAWEIDNSSANGLTVSGSISDGGLGFSLGKTGVGTLILSGTETYTGGTNVQNGTLQMAPGGILVSTSAVTLGSGTNSGVLVLGSAGGTDNLTIGSLTTSGTGSAADAVVGGNSSVSTLTLSNSAADSYAGLIGGTGTNQNQVALTKSGAGTLTLSGNNTYTGGTVWQRYPERGQRECPGRFGQSHFHRRHAAIFRDRNHRLFQPHRQQQFGDHD